MIFGARVEQAREFRCMTQMELATAIGVNQTAIARVESGGLALSDLKEADIAAALQFPIGFFQRDVPEFFPLGTLEFRANADTPAKEKKRAHQYASIVFELATGLSARLKPPPMRLPRLSGTPEEAAASLRSELALSPNTPIRNLTAVLERAGVLVFSLPDLRAGLHGFSVWGAVGRKLLPAIYVSADALGDRARHTLAHEAGELTLEDMPPGRERERYASRFAGALLMPADALRRDLVPPVDLTDFYEIKQKYGVSAQSAIMRARQLEIITANRYTNLFRQIGASGMRTREDPEYDVAREKPRALHKMAEMLYGEHVDFKRLAEDARLDPWLVRSILTAHGSKGEMRQSIASTGEVIPFRRPARAKEDAIEA